MCDIPNKESTRRACLNILSTFSSPSIYEVNKIAQSNGTFSKKNKVQIKNPKTTKSKQKEVLNDEKKIDDYIDIAVKSYSLPEQAATKFKRFLSFGCILFSADINAAIDALSSAIQKMRANDNTKNDPRRSKRYDDISRSIRSLRNLIDAVKLLGIEPLVSIQNKNLTKNPEDSTTTQISSPAFFCLDLGLRQRRKNIHGHLLYQAFIVPDIVLNDKGNNGEIDSNPSAIQGIKVAEGGRYGK